METLHSSSRIPFFVCRSLKTKRKINERQNRNRFLDRKNNTPNPSYYPKSTPTPLLNNQTPPHLLTEHQALDNVLKDLQASINRGIKIDQQIFSSLLETCFRMQSLHHGILLHYLIPSNLLRKSPDLSSKLLRLYASFGLVEHAHQLFDEMPHPKVTAFAWNSLISGYAELGLYEDAMALYYQMEEEGVEPDRFTFPRVLKACAGLGFIHIGEAVHRHIVRSGFATDEFALNAIVDMYAKCGDIVKARKIFDKIPRPDSISWNSMLTGYIRHRLLVEALEVFRGMLRAGCEPDSVTISSILARFFPLRFGIEIHGWVLRHAIDQNLSVANSLIGMYSEHGQLDRASAIFKAMPEKDLVSWNAMLTAHSRDRDALEIFHQMEKSSIAPDEVTFVPLLAACAHLGLVEKGQELLRKMEVEYLIKPQMEHYACMVNLLARAGLIDEAIEIIEKRMGFEAGPTVWGALLYGCSLHGNADVGEVAAERLFELEPDNAHNFELLMKIYRIAGRWEEMEKVRKLMEDRGLD